MKENVVTSIKPKIRRSSKSLICKCYYCRKEKEEREFFHCALCSNQECSKSQISQFTPFYCDFCWNKKAFYPNCWKCKSLKLKSGIL